MADRGGDNTTVYIILGVVVVLLIALVLGLSFGMNVNTVKAVKNVSNTGKLVQFTNETQIQAFNPTPIPGFVYIGVDGLPVTQPVNLGDPNQVTGTLLPSLLPAFTGAVTNPNPLNKADLEISNGAVGNPQLALLAVANANIQQGAVGDAQGSLANKPPVRLVATAQQNLALSLTGVTIDNVTVAAGDVILLTSQTTSLGVDNGPWVAGTTNTRPAWYMPPVLGQSNPSQAAYQNSTVVLQGSSYSNSRWYISTANPIVIGTTATTWTQVLPSPFSPPLVITGKNANALEVVPTTGGIPAFNVDTTGTGTNGINIVSTTNGAQLSTLPALGNQSLLLQGVGTGGIQLQDGVLATGDVVAKADLVVVDSSATALTVSKLTKTAPAFQVNTINSGATTFSSGLLVTSQDSTTNTGVLVQATSGSGVGQSIKMDASAAGGNIELNNNGGVGPIVMGQNVQFNPIGSRSVSYGAAAQGSALTLSLLGNNSTGALISGGQVQVVGGTSANSTGGPVLLQGGASTVGTGGMATVSDGFGATGGGGVKITGTTPTGLSGAGGPVTITTGTGMGSAGGLLFMQTGGGSAGGAITLETGTSFTGSGGVISLLSGNGATIGGGVILEAGAGIANGIGGSSAMTGGAGAGTGSGGNVTLDVGAAGGTSPSTNGFIALGSNGTVPLYVYANQFIYNSNTVLVTFASSPVAVKVIDSGKVFLVNAAGGDITINLPSTAQAGLRYTFVQNAVASTHKVIITSATATSMAGCVVLNATATASNSGLGTTTVQFSGTSRQGDRVELIYDGSFWSVFGLSSAAAGLSFV